MKRLLITLAILALASPLLAEPRKARSNTFVVSDGKVFMNGQPLELWEGGGKRAYLGVSLVEISDDLREHFGAPKDAGVLVGGVDDNGPAEKAGIRVGDIILSVDGKDVASSRDLRSALRDRKDGDSVRVEVLRGKSRQTLNASVIEKERAPWFNAIDFGNVQWGDFGEALGSPNWRAHIMSTRDCDDLQSKLRELETRMKDLEKKLPK